MVKPNNYLLTKIMRNFQFSGMKKLKISLPHPLDGSLLQFSCPQLVELELLSHYPVPHQLLSNISFGAQQLKKITLQCDITFSSEVEVLNWV